MHVSCLYIHSDVVVHSEPDNGLTDIGIIVTVITVTMLVLITIAIIALVICTCIHRRSVFVGIRDEGIYICTSNVFVVCVSHFSSFYFKLTMYKGK